MTAADSPAQRSRITGQRQRSVLALAVPLLALALATSLLVGGDLAHVLKVGAVAALIAVGPLRILWLAVRFTQDRDPRFLFASLALLAIIGGGALAAAV